VDAPTRAAPPPVTLGAGYRPLFARRPSHRYTLIEGGRGSAKSWHAATALLNLTYEPGHVILYTRWTMVSAKISIIPEFEEKIALLGRGADFRVEEHEVVNLRTGSRILFRGIKTSAGNQTASLKSIHGITVWVLDEAEEMPDEATFDKIDLSIRSVLVPNRVWIVLNPPDLEHWICKRWHRAPATPAPLDAPTCAAGIRGCTHRDDTLYLHSTWEGNREHLSPEWIAQAERMRTENPVRYGNVFGGRYATFAAGGVLWTDGDVRRSRIGAVPDGLVRVFVAVDPAVSTEATSDETGIVVAGMDRLQCCYVLEDLSGR
jgi:phage terminase large subunit